MDKHRRNDGALYIKSRSISEPDISFDKSAIYANRFKSKHFPFEYIAVDDLHYYRRRKPYLFQSNLSLYNNNERCLNENTEYRRAYVEKPIFGKLEPLKRPSNLKVDAYPFLTGIYRSDSSLNCCSYTTEYDTNFHERAFSPRIGPIRRATNIKLSAAVMDNSTEQKSQFRAYSNEIVSKARPPMIKKPNNLQLTGNIELFPEYRSKFVRYSEDSIFKSNKVPCFHAKREKKVRKVQELNEQNRELDKQIEMEERRKAMEAKMCNNNYGMNTMNRYHEKLDSENNYIPEYRSKYRPVVGERSSLVPQHSHFQKYDGEFDSTSEYNNRYKIYDHYAKSAPIKKQDNLYMKGYTQMQPEYTDRYKQIDYGAYSRQKPVRHQDNLHSDGKFPSQGAEYSEKYKGYDVHDMPEKAKGRDDFLHLNGDMTYDDEYRSNYVEFPRQRPIVKKPSTHINVPARERDGKPPKNVNLPISLSYHDPSSFRHMSRNESLDSEPPIENTPEYRRAYKNYLLKERSPTRGSPEIQQPPGKSDKNNNKPIDHNDVTKILTENKVNVPEEKIFNENNEVIVEPLKKPSNFKIPTRSPTNLSLGRGASYPIEKDNFNQHTSISLKPRKQDVSFDIDEDQRRVSSQDYDDYTESDHNINQHRFQHELVEPYEKAKKSPKFGRRAPNPREDYNVRKKTSVIEGNATYGREYRPNRHEQRAYKLSPPFATKPSDPLANNYRPNYEIDKQQSYRESLGNREPFVVLDREIAKANASVKQSSWMKKQWYDTN